MDSKRSLTTDNLVLYTLVCNCPNPDSSVTELPDDVTVKNITELMLLTSNVVNEQYLRLFKMSLFIY